MQSLEVSGAVGSIYGSLGVKRLNEKACAELAPGTDESDGNAIANSWAKS